MKITALRTIPLSFPIVCPLGTSYSATGYMGGLAVFVDSDQGVSGEGVLIALNDKRLRIQADMVESFAPLLIGRDPAHSEEIALRCFDDASNFGVSGLVNMAIGAIDSALLDLRAKLVNLPVHRLLGAAQSRVPAYYSSGLWRNLPLDELLRNADNIIAHGYRAMKMRASPGNVGVVVERVRRMREAIGPDVKLLLDLGSRFEFAETLHLGRRLDEYELEWIEEPLSDNRHAEEAQIARELATPLASGEGVFSLDEFGVMIDTRCVDVLMPDLCRVGGPRQFLRVARMAERVNMPVSGHVLPEHTLGLMASIPNGSWLEVMPWSSPIFADEIRIEDGCAILPEKPGFGYALDPAALKKYALR